MAHAAILIALGSVLSCFRLFALPFGGSVTLCSLMFYCLIGYLFGIRIGLLSTLAAGIIQFMIYPIFIHPLQFIFDYIIGYGVLGFTGLKMFRDRQFVFAYVFVITLRLIASTLSGIIFFNAFVPSGSNIILYSLTYNLSYTLPEALLTLLLLRQTRFRNAIQKLKRW